MPNTNGPPSPRRILGVDPGLRITGYGVLEVAPQRPRVCEAGIVRPADDDATDLASRLLSVYKGIVEVVQQYRPEVMVVEQLYSHYEHPRTAILMAHARGAILYAATERNALVVHYTPRQIKRLLTGSGDSSCE